MIFGPVCGGVGGVGDAVGGGGGAGAVVGGVVSGLRSRLGVWFWFGDRFEVEEDLVLEVSGDRCWAGEVPGLPPGCCGRLCGGQAASGSLACGCSFGFGRGLVDEVGGEGEVGGGGGGRPRGRR